MAIKFGQKRMSEDWRGATCTVPILEDGNEIGQLIRFNANAGSKTATRAPWEVKIRSTSHGKKLTLEAAKTYALEQLEKTPGASTEKRHVDEAKSWPIYVRTQTDTLILGEAKCIKVEGRYIIETPKFTLSLNEVDVLEISAFHRLKPPVG